MTQPQLVPLQLVPRLRALMDPLVAIVAATVWLSPPVLWLAFEVGELRLHAEAAAAQLADRIEREVDERPDLWRYDSLKLLQHAKPLLSGTDLAAVRLVDHAGTPLDARAAGTDERGPLLWQSFPVRVGGAAPGSLWVATSMRRALHTALALVGGFGVLAAALGALLWWVPLRMARAAESGLRLLWDEREASRLALQNHNDNLEAQVAARTAELRAQQAALRQLSARATTVQAAERKALARELHDDLGQTLTALRLRLQVAAQANPTLGESVALVDAAIDSVRRAVLSLAPTALDELGLTRAVTRLCESLQEEHGIAACCNGNLQGAQPDTAVEWAAYRIAQEALTNVVRHSGARHVTVSLAIVGDALHLTVGDDGRGIGSAAPRAGRTSMTERAALLGGTLDVGAVEGGGTRVHAVLPLGDPSTRHGAAP
ncbi:MAG: sensor histidine kinase [Deltaproteobacteria bacterium]|nr:sensor histidine kinase [Deltaproteobacteria bacterium]